MSNGIIRLGVLLWANDGRQSELITYEDRVLAFVGDHGGAILQRARTEGGNDQPLEIQIFEFPSQSALDGYLNDERRLALADERDHAVARTEMMNISLIG